MERIILERKINEQLQKRFGIKKYTSSENVVARDLQSGMGSAVLYVNTYDRMQLEFHTDRRFSPVMHACSLDERFLLRLVNEILTQA